MVVIEKALMIMLSSMCTYKLRAFSVCLEKVAHTKAYLVGRKGFYVKVNRRENRNR